ncbi:MAG: MFS transporter [Cyanosarcina radialis HA8281-LM2]|jgi:DHA1 family multidrug resistance protein-like MFS transporter|nr:MFS transporter [Cyanosarcina radialis HA8281-LM2]
MNKRVFVLLFCLFVVTIGFGVTLPVLPFYAKHLHATVGGSREAMAIHISLLTSIYALAQFVFAPFWGQYSDRVGRRPPILLGIAGAAIAQVLFGLASSLTMLYVIRAVGGFLSSATLPAATAYISDITPERDRSRHMAWLGTAVSLGVIAGPAFSGLTTREDFHLTWGFLDIKIENFAPPFFFSALLMVLTLPIAIRWLPESLPVRASSAARERFSLNWRNLKSTLLLLLGLTLAGQFGLAVFEGTFALYAQERFGYGPTETGMVFLVCGLVMAVFQAIAVGYLAGRMRTISQVAFGFGLMGTGIFLLPMATDLPFVLGVVSLLSIGMALIAPNLAALISQQGGQHQGVVLGLQTAANSLGQVGGPLLGGILFAWQNRLPYLFAGTFLAGIGVLIGLNKRRKQRSSN